jgi:hypothetical protein
MYQMPTNKVVDLSQHILESGCGVGLAVGASIIIIWCRYMVRRDMMIKLMMHSSSVKLNIMLNRAGLLLISIYINDVRCRIQQQQHHFGEMSAYHAPPARLVENANKDDAWSNFHRAVNIRPIHYIPTRIPITYTIRNASTCSV